MSKCSFLFVNYIYLIYFTVLNLINHKLLQNFAHVPCILQHFAATYPGISNVAWNQSVVVRIPVVISSPTYNISMIKMLSDTCSLAAFKRLAAVSARKV